MLLNALRTLAAGLAVAVLAARGSSVAPVPAERVKVEKELAAVATKLHGSWQGGPCEGCITLRADRTYEWVGIGPGGECHAGAWWLRGDPAKPVLVMACKEADDPDRAGKTTEATLARFDAKSFSLAVPDGEGPKTFERTKKDANEP